MLWQAVPVQLLPASEMFFVIIDGICFKTFQLFRGVQRRLFRFTYQPLKQQQQSLYRLMLIDQTQIAPASCGVTGFYWCPTQRSAKHQNNEKIKASWDDQIVFQFYLYSGAILPAKR